MKKDNQLIKKIRLEKKRNFENNLKFVVMRAKWLMNVPNNVWSKRQKLIIDEVYKANRV